MSRCLLCGNGRFFDCSGNDCSCTCHPPKAAGNRAAELIAPFKSAPKLPEWVTSDKEYRAADLPPPPEREPDELPGKSLDHKAIREAVQRASLGCICEACCVIRGELPHPTDRYSTHALADELGTKDATISELQREVGRLSMALSRAERKGGRR